MLDRFVGLTGELRGRGGGRDVVVVGTRKPVDKARVVERRMTGVQFGWWFAPQRKREAGWVVGGTPEDREARRRRVAAGGDRHAEILP